MVAKEGAGDSAVRSAPGQPRKSAAARHLTRQDWVNATWKALVDGSIETVKVDRLALDLKVSRGSFYWHFKDKKDLVESVLDYWLQQLGLNEAISPVIAELKHPEDVLWAIYEYVIRNNGPQSVHLRLWAHKSKQIYERMKQEDNRRLEHYTVLFKEIGFEEAEAARRASAYFGLALSEYLRNGDLPIEQRFALAREQHDLLVSD